MIKFALNFVAKYKNRWIVVELDHTKWQNTWNIVPSTLQYAKNIWNWFPLSGKIDGQCHAHNRISNRSDAPLIFMHWTPLLTYFLWFLLPFLMYKYCVDHHFPITTIPLTKLWIRPPPPSLHTFEIFQSSPSTYFSNGIALTLTNQKCHW